MHLTNVRELSAWVTTDRAAATAKALAYVRAAVRRVQQHEPLERREMALAADALVIGAGPAGIEASLTLAQKGRTVFLVEKRPYIGGKPMQYDEVFPTMECSSCMLEAKMAEVLHHERIRLLTGAEVESVLGYFGNFIVRVRHQARYVNPATCIGCGACYPSCPVEVASEFDQGLSRRKAIFVPYPGALPNVPVLDREHCLHFGETGCTACRDACPFGGAGYIDFEAEDTTMELTVGALVVATGFELAEGPAFARLGHRRLPEVYSSLEFERVLSPNGPTAGKLVTAPGKPVRSVLLVQCADREDGPLGFCSGVCCFEGLKLARTVRHRAPDATVTLVHRDWCLPGREGQRFLRDAVAEGVRFLRVGAHTPLDVRPREDRLEVRVSGATGWSQALAADMVVLVGGMRPGEGSDRLARLLGIPLDESGFFQAEHGRLASVATVREGIYLAGSARGPTDIQGAIASGAAAAGKILSRLLPGDRLELDPAVTSIERERCSGCRVCLTVCPYGAIRFDEAEHACEASAVLCRGCGSCAASCPSGAARSLHFTVEQIFAEIEGLVP
jgi:heterodisulfide reductase subunit A